MEENGTKIESFVKVNPVLAQEDSSPMPLENSFDQNGSNNSYIGLVKEIHRKRLEPKKLDPSFIEEDLDIPSEKLDKENQNPKKKKFKLEGIKNKILGKSNTKVNQNNISKSINQDIPPSVYTKLAMGYLKEISDFNNLNENTLDNNNSHPLSILSGKSLTNIDQKINLTVKSFTSREDLLSPKDAIRLNEKLMLKNKDCKKKQVKHVEYLLQKNNEIENKNKVLAVRYLQEEMKECTFNPKLMNSNETTKECTEISFDKFYQNQIEKKKEYELNKERLRIELETEKSQPYKPSINPKSKELAISRLKRDVLCPFTSERLYCTNIKNKKFHKQKKSEDFFKEKHKNSEVLNKYLGDSETKKMFSPRILQKSKEIVRSEPVENLLYNDFLRRKMQTTSYLNTSQQGEIKKKRDFKGEQMFMKSFKREFGQAVGCAKKVRVEELGSLRNILVNLDELEEILCVLGFLPKQHELRKSVIEEIWKGLQGDNFEGIRGCSLELFLMCLYGVADENFLEDESEEREQEFGRFDERGVLFLTNSEVEKIERNYHELLLNRLANKECLKRTRSVENKTSPSTFISEISEKIAEEKRLKLINDIDNLNMNNCSTSPRLQAISSRIHTINLNKSLELKDLVWYHEAKRELEKENLRKRYLEKELEPCTFHPEINKGTENNGEKRGIEKSLKLFEKAQRRGKRIDRSPLEIDYEKQCDQCTFTPELGTTKLYYREYVCKNKTKDVIIKNVQRIKEARLEKKCEDALRNKGFTFNEVLKEEAMKKVIKNEDEEIKNLRNERMSVRKPKLDHLNKSSFLKSSFSNLSKISRVSEYKEKEALIALENSNEIESKKDHPSPQMTTFNLSSSLQNNNVKPFSSEEVKAPLLLVDVNLDENKTVRIVVFEKERPDEIAKKFAEEHQLDEEMTKKLKEMLEMQIKGVLEKIEEESETASHTEEQQTEENE